MIINEQKIDEFLIMQKQLRDFVELSGFTTKTYLANKMGWSRFTLVDRLKKQAFTGGEMKKLAKILNSIKVG